MPQDLLKILIIEDEEDAALLLLRELGQNYPNIEHRLISTKEELVDALPAQTWDIVTCDFQMPNLDATEALKLVKEHGNEIPFLLVSGEVKDESAIKLIKAGAHDYLNKNQLHFLNTAVFRGLNEAAMLRAQKSDHLKLQNSEDRFRDFAEASSDWFWEMDADLRYTYISPHFEQKTGTKTEDVIGTKRWHNSPEEQDKKAWEAHKVVLASRQKFKYFEYIIRTQNNDILLVSANGVPVFDGGGNFKGYRGSTTNITKRKLLETQLAQAQKMEAVGQLTGGIAHDFNNILQILMGYNELLLDEVEGNENAVKLLELEMQAVSRAASLTSRLLAFSRQQSLVPSVSDIKALVSGLEELFRRTLGETVETIIDHAPDVWPVSIDASQLEHALINLAVNARDAMPGGGSLTIKTSNAILDEEFAQKNDEVTPGEYVLVTVSDTGLGMPAEVLEHVFEPFFTTKEIGKGSGLGLSMVFGFVKQSRGHITISSEFGQGTSIQLYLPRSTETATQTAMNTEKNSIASETDTARILIVEDNSEVRQVSARILQGLSYETVEARNGDEALRHLQGDRRFDLLFTDMMLPGGISGAEISEEAKRLQPEIKVLFTSGYTPESFAQKRQSEIEGFLVHKPYRKAELVDKVRETLKR